MIIIFIIIIIATNFNFATSESESKRIGENSENSYLNLSFEDENTIDKNSTPNEKETPQIELSKHTTGFNMKLLGIIIVIVGFILLGKYMRD